MQLQDKAVTLHVAQNTSGRRSAIGDRITRHPGYAISQRIRNRVEEAFDWTKTVAGLRKMRHRGCSRSTDNSPSRWPPTTSSGCPYCSLRFSMSRHTSHALRSLRSAPHSTCRKRIRHGDTDARGSHSA
jgi:hypothetical protein